MDLDVENGRKETVSDVPTLTECLFYVNPLGVWLHVAQDVHNRILLNIPKQSSEAAGSMSLEYINPLIVKASGKTFDHFGWNLLNSTIILFLFTHTHWNKNLERSSRRDFLLESALGTTVYVSPCPLWPSSWLVHPGTTPSARAVLGRNVCFHRGTS